MKKLIFAALLLAATVTGRAATVATQSESFSGVYTTTTFTQYAGVAVYGSLNNNNFSSLTLPVFASVPVNTPLNLGPVTVQVPVGATNLRVTVASVYGSASSSTVSLVLDSTFALTITASGGQAFGTAFPGADETTIATYIKGAATGNSTAIAGLEAFFNTFNADFPLIGANNSATGTLVTFSNAAAGGNASLILAPVPEPSAALWLLAAGGAVVAAVRRKPLRSRRAMS